MNQYIKIIVIICAISIFTALPLILFITGDFPKRTFLKDTLSIITILTFFVVLGQFYVSKFNQGLESIFKYRHIVKFHKVIGYAILPILLFHPIFIVVPRFFEVGAPPLEGFIRMITSFDTLGVLVGIIAWVLMLLLGLTSMFRDRLKLSYKMWKIFHGLLSLAFIGFASWHAIDLGRHMSVSMITLIIVIASIASFLLIKTYFFKEPKITTHKDIA